MYRNKVKDWEEILKDKNAREMINHLHEFTYLKNTNRRMTI